MTLQSPMQKYDGRTIKSTPADQASRVMTYRHAGDVGDLLFALPAVRHNGRGIVYLEAANYTRVPLTPDNWRGIDRILKAQPYIDDVRQWKGEPTDINLNDFRSAMFRHVRHRHHIDRHIADWTAMVCNLPTSIKDEPWLTIPDPIAVAPVVISRSGPGRPPHSVYHGQNFPWGQVLRKYGKDAVFVGTELEHEIFQAVFGDITWYPTATLFEVAQVIAGAKLFIGSQSAPNAIAQGLGVATVLEIWHQGPNSSGWRKNHINGWDHKCPLPDI